MIQTVRGNVAEQGKAPAGMHRIVTVEVIEDFSGDVTPGRRVEVATGLGGGDCGYPFLEGETYLIDAFTGETGLFVSLCSATEPALVAGMTFRTLQSQASGMRPPDLRGAAFLHSTGHNARLFPSTPLASVPISITGLDGHLVRTAVTASDGVFEVPSLPPGVYSVKFGLPPQLVSSAEENTIGIAVPEAGGRGAGCEMALQVFTNGRVTGRVVDLNAQGVPGEVSAFPYEADGEVPRIASARTETSKGTGAFTLGPLDAGDYWVVFQPEQPRRQLWFYPGQEDRAGARLVRVEAGQTTSDVTLTLP